MKTKLTPILALALALTGCNEDIAVWLVSFDSDIQPVTDPSPEVKDALDEAFGFWGLEYKLLGDDAPLGSYGALRITVIPKSSWATIEGGYSKLAPCRHIIEVMPDGHKLAHEMGHAWLGYDHADDDENLMNASADEWELTDEQWDDAEKAINRFQACLDSAH